MVALESSATMATVTSAHPGIMGLPMSLSNPVVTTTSIPQATVTKEVVMVAPTETPKEKTSSTIIAR